MKRIVPFRHAEPLGQMNVTPFIDVMLVLLVMLIITIPMQSHKVAVDLPQPGPGTKQDLPHKLGMERDGSIWWDGRRVTDSQLPPLLAEVARNDAALQLQIDPEARYERFDQLLAIVKAGGVTKLGFVGHERMTF